MKIELDRDTCIGSATCVAFAPSVFKLDGDGLAVLLVEDTDGLDDVDMDEVVACCPTGSIQVVDAS